MKRTGVSLLFLALTASSVHASDLVASGNNWLETRMSSGSGSPLELIYLFLGGLLASLLPCVYPIYPMTATLLRNRGDQSTGRWAHPLTYYFGLVTIYFTFGLIAALSGGAFNQILRLPETNLALAFLFLVLALSTSGFIYFNFGGHSGSTVNQGLLGTFMMGIGAGLLSSSCVGPFVVGILVHIAGAVGQISALSVASAAFQMMAFGMGLGIPMLLIALFGMRLPKSGKWMQYVQYLLGLLILYFSYVYLEKGLTSLGYTDDKVRLCFIGTLILLFAAFKVQGDEIDEFKRMGRALAALMLAIGFLCLQGSVSPTSAVISANGSDDVASSHTEKSGNLTWYTDYAEAQKAAAAQGKPIFLDFSAHWCANCKAFEELTQSNAKFNAALGSVVLCKIKDTSPDFKKFQGDPRCPELKVGLPFLLILDTKGNLLYKTSDYTRVDDMMLFME